MKYSAALAITLVGLVVHAASLGYLALALNASGALMILSAVVPIGIVSIGTITGTAGRHREGRKLHLITQPLFIVSLVLVSVVGPTRVTQNLMARRGTAEVGSPVDVRAEFGLLPRDAGALLLGSPGDRGVQDSGFSA